MIIVGELTVALQIIARCSLTQTPTEQSNVLWWHARKNGRDLFQANLNPMFDGQFRGLWSKE